MDDQERTMWAEKVAKYSRVLSRILTKCTFSAGEDHPASYRACIWCGLIEDRSEEFHKPDCPVVEAKRMIARDFYR